MGETPLVRCIERQYTKARLASKKAPSSGWIQVRKNAPTSRPQSTNEKPIRQAELVTILRAYPFSLLVTMMFATIPIPATTHTNTTTFHTATVFVGGLGTAENSPQPHPVSRAICAIR